MSIGIARNGSRASGATASTNFSGSLRGDVLFGRDRDADFGLGPYLELGTVKSFSDLELNAGASLLVPVGLYMPVVLSVGGFAGHTRAWGWEPGLATRLFWGSRSYNYHSYYGMAFGLFLETRYALGPSEEVSVVGGAQLDFELLTLPFILVFEALRGHPR